MTQESASPLADYATAIRRHWLLVVLSVLVATGGAIFVATRQKPVYDATAQVLVTPIDDEAYLGLDLVRNSGDPERTALTAAGLLDSSAAAEAAAKRLGDITAPEVRAAVRVAPEGESNLLAITATASTPERAIRLANEFANRSLQARRDRLREQIESELPRLQRRRASFPPDDYSARDDLIERIAELEGIYAAGRDPTLQLTRAATASASSQTGRYVLVGGLAVLAGLVVGALGAFLLELLSRNVRDENELLLLYPVPILARIPPVPHRRGASTLEVFDLPPPAREAFRTLRAQLEPGDGSNRSIMLTSASARDGKTTAAASLAVAMAAAHYTVALLDLDLRRPEIAAALGVKPGPGWGALSGSGDSLQDLLVDVPDAPGLRVLPAREGDAAFIESLIRGLPGLLEQARDCADVVIIDTPPLGEVSDALRIAPLMDSIVLVARLGHTRRASFVQVRDLLERAGARPQGLLLTGSRAAGAASSRYYTYGKEGAAK